MLQIHRSESADVLVAALGELLDTPVGDAFAPELVAVPSRGVERWLAQQLSHRLGATSAGGDGVCANVLFPSSSRLLDDAAIAADASYAAAVECWSAERAVWPLMTIIDETAPSASWAGVLAVHLGLSAGATDRGRRFAVASKLSRHFASYATARPAMVTAWRDGRDEQGDGTPLPDDLRWQPELWRLLRARLGASPAELLPAAGERLRRAPGAVPLPQRLSIFGPTRISPTRLAVLAALAEHRDVHLWLHHPSPALWETLRTTTPRPGRRRDDPADSAVRNPLLASLSRDLRELQQLLPVPDQDSHHRPPPRAATLLGRLQDDLAHDRRPSGPTPVDAGDRSLVVHACHGPARQVEVVREAVLGLLAADPTLEPRDIVIMCPDVETFAPLVAASFGLTDEPGGHPAARLRVRLADRSLRQTNPLLNLLGRLLELAADRVTATQLLDLAGTAPVRARFGFSDDDIEQLRTWATGANARWGIDAAHRAPYHLAGLEQGTWRAAVDRMLLGVAMEEDERWIGDVLPLDDVDSGDIDLVGRLAELLDRVEVAVRALQQSRPVARWAEVLDELVTSLGEPAQPWQAAQLRGELAELAAAAGETDVALGRADVSAMLAAQLSGRPTRASFRTGALTVCTLVPMRSVPHRVVCLLGMDDGAFPRHTVVDGDDVLARDPRTGERDVRSEDRQLFLDAICAAQEHLVITYTGADPRSGAAVPPCVPLGELLDAVDAVAQAPDGGPGRMHVVIAHPLQPFDPRNFDPGRLGTDGPFSFDPAGLAGARAAAGPRHPAPPLVSAPLPPLAPEATVDLEQLVQFLQHPTRAFLRQRLGISTYEDDDDPADALPVELDNLQLWAVGDRLLRRRLARMSPATCFEIETRRGDLPPGRLGQRRLVEIGRTVEALVQACATERATPARAVDVAVALDDGRRLEGTVTGVRGAAVLSVSYSSLGPRQRLAGWVSYLALTAGTGDAGLRGVTVGRSADTARRRLVQGIEPGEARGLLTELVRLRDVGLQAPLPMALRTSEAYATERRRDEDVVAALRTAERRWLSGNFPGEQADPAHVLVHGAEAPLASLTVAGPGPGESWPGETTRFGVLARQLWSNLLDAETEVRP